MAAFGSFALLIALALAAYNLLAGALALRLIATGQPTAFRPSGWPIPRGGRESPAFAAVTAAAFALVWSVFTNDFSITYIAGALQPRAARRLQIFRSVERAGGFAALVGVAAGGLTALCCG
jgi:cytochrome c biogenesis factor